MRETLRKQISLASSVVRLRSLASGSGRSRKSLPSQVINELIPNLSVKVFLPLNILTSFIVPISTNIHNTGRKELLEQVFIAPHLDRANTGHGCGCFAASASFASSSVVLSCI